MRHRLGLARVEQVLPGLALEGHAFRHAVVQQRGGGVQLVGRQRLARAQQPTLHLEPELGDALDTMDRQAAVVRDVGGLAGPGRHGAQARHHDYQGPFGLRRRRVTVGEQRRQLVQRRAVGRRVAPDPVHMARAHADDARAGLPQPRQQALGAEGGQGVAALEVHQVLGGGSHAVGAVPARGAGFWRGGRDFTGRVG
jgi:hypothetical protein